MKGKILNYNEADKTGIISGDDGKRYGFNAHEWKSSVGIRAGGKVDFATDSGDRAVEIYADGVSLNGASKKIPAALFAFFLGAFGAHKFYLGYKKQGFIMLLVFIFGFILLGFPSMIIGLIAFIEFILYLIKSDEEFEQTYVVGRKAWF